MTKYVIRQGRFDCIGYLVTCSRCGRKLIVEVVINGTNHNVHCAAICAECVQHSEDFRREHPDVCRQIEEWKGR